MSYPFMCNIPSIGVGGRKPLNKLLKIAVSYGPEQQMPMGWHEAVRKNSHLSFDSCFIQ